MGDTEALELLKRDLAPLDSSWVDPLEAMRQPLPDWRGWPPARLLQYLRCRLRWSQADLARGSGVSARQLTRLEAGEDASLSTWRSVFEAMGFQLALTPTTTLTKNELIDRSEAACPAKRRFRQRARPRRDLAP